MKSNQKKKKYKYSKIIISIILASILFITTGYANHSNDLSINTSAFFRIQRDIRITNVVAVETTSNATPNWENHNVDKIMAGISLPNSDSTVTYNINVTNVGNIEACISEITGLPSNLEYTLDNYSLNDMMCDSQDSTLCKLGSTSTISMTIGYKDGGYDSSNTNYNIEMDFTFSYMIDAVARIDDSFYDTLQEAIDAVPTDGSETTIILINNTSEAVTIAQNKNIQLNLNNKILSNTGNTNVIVNNGTLRIYGGTITSDAIKNGAINNEATGTIIIDSIRVDVTGGRQVLYNNGGNATITGNAYLTTTTTERATVQNLANGTLTILGGTIISAGSYAVNNAGTMTIGVKDGTINKNSPIFQAINYGIISSTNFNFYDGTVKSKAAAFNNTAKIVDKEEGYKIINGTEVINGVTYKTAHLGITKTVTFNANTGSVSEQTRYVETGEKVGTLPVPEKTGFEFLGWYTLQNGGDQIDSNTIINNNVTFYAHWSSSTKVAQIGPTIYETLVDAIAAAPNNTSTTITLLKDTSEILKVGNSKNITIDLNGKTLGNSGSSPIIENNGTISLINGSLRTTAEQSAINNVSGYLTINNCHIVATGSKQAVYITGGTVEIKGNSYLSSKTTGKAYNSDMERGTVQVISGTLIITGGRIVGEKQHAVANEDLLIIGSKDGNINASTPILEGFTNGIKSSGTLYFYDGIAKGISDAISGNVSDMEDNSSFVNGTENIDGVSYKTAYLESN